MLSMCIFPVKKTASTQCWIEWYPNYIIFSFSWLSMFRRIYLYFTSGTSWYCGLFYLCFGLDFGICLCLSFDSTKKFVDQRRRPKLVQKSNHVVNCCSDYGSGSFWSQRRGYGLEFGTRNHGGHVCHFLFSIFHR